MAWQCCTPPSGCRPFWRGVLSVRHPVRRRGRGHLCKEHLSMAPGRYRVRCRLYEAMEDSSRITRAPVDAPANPGIRPGGLETLLRARRTPDPLKMIFQK